MPYPTRCRILDVTGEPSGFCPEIERRTPKVSKPHIGKEGLAEEVGEFCPGIKNVRITLDDGTILWGHDCWWEPIEAAESAKGTPAG